MVKWTVSRSTSKFGNWHVQARTEDQLCSFAIEVPKSNQTFFRGKTADGKHDVFAVAIVEEMHATMNIVGKIKYDGEW